MNRQVMRVAAGVNLVAGCLLLQGCGMFGKKTDQPVTQLPGGEQPPVEVQPVEPATPAAPVETAPVELPSVQSTTAYTIQKGDTISAVAYKYNLRWQDIVAVNPGVSPNRLRVGQVIQLPGLIELGKVRHVPVATPKVSGPKVSAPKAKASAAAVAGPVTTYVVKSGDSLSLIAYKHGVKTAVLREANGLKSDRIVVGQKLKVPGAKKHPAASATASKKSSAAAPKTAAPKTSVAPKAATGEAKPADAVTPPPPAVVEPAAAPATAATPVESAVAAPAPAAATAAPAAAPAPAADANTQTYTVKEGEDLYAVAIRWGVSPSDLKSLNNLTTTELKAGTVLKIPGGAQ